MNIRKQVILFASLLLAGPARATLFHSITGETASVTSAGSLTENGTTYVGIFKPSTPPPSYVHLPWVDTAHAYRGQKSIGFEIDPTPSPVATDTDKTQLRISHAGESSDLEFGNTRYLGFAVDIPSANFQGPSKGAVQLAQWWQGSPYTPPLSVTITGATATAANYEVRVYNNTTLGNPSSVPVILSTGTIPFDTWTNFTVMTLMDYTGGGQVKLWQNGSQLVNWTGAVGYDPTTIPYKNPPAGTDNPNTAFDVFFGPYREQQSTTQELFYDEIRWADTFVDAQPAPEPGCLCLPSLMILSSRRRRRFNVRRWAASPCRA
jgi:hypothetical protein